MEMQLDLENYPIWYKPFWQTLSFKIGLVLVILCLISGLFFLIYRVYKNKKKLFWQIALQDLKNIENFNQDLKDSYFKLTSILKFYFSNRFNQDFYIKTDDEIILEIKKIQELDIFHDDLKKIFLTAKLIKFSNKEASATLFSDLSLSKSIIESTIEIKEK